MKKPTSYIAAFSLVAFALMPMVSSAQSLTVAQLQAEIQALTAQVQSLQQLLASAQGGSVPWCYGFSVNLSTGMTGSVVTGLQTALQKDGESVNVNGIFDDQTTSAVINFQEKYSTQILVPNGLQKGTGYVGPSTRIELNTLFACRTQDQISTPVVVSPPPVVPPVVIITPTSTPTSTTPTPTSTLITSNKPITTALGATTGRIKSPTDMLGTISFAANGSGGVELNKITITFGGSVLSTGSSTLLGSAQLLDFHNVSVISDGATVSMDPIAGTVTWTFPAGTAGYFIPSGASYPFTLVVDSAAVSSLGYNVSESLNATIPNASDIQYSTSGSTGLSLPSLSFPLTINSMNYLVGQ